MKGVSGVLIGGVGGALLIVALILAISAGLSNTIGAVFFYAVLFGFTAFFFLGMGFIIMLHAQKASID